MLAAFPARATADVSTVIQDDKIFLHAESDAALKSALDQARSLGIDTIRVTAGWSVLAPQPDSPTKPDFDATDPAAYPRSGDQGAQWASLDRLVRMASAAGLRVMIDIAFWAPRWATKDPADAKGRLRTSVDPQAYADFAAAVARRYSGSWSPPAPPSSPPPAQDDPGSSPDSDFLSQLFGGGKKRSRQASPGVQAASTLPKVAVYTLWNEPNYQTFLMPQWVQRGDGSWWPQSATIYRAMVQAAYPAVKRVAPDSRVLIGGTASLGASTPAPGRGVPPLAFLRALACVDKDLQPITTGDCASFQPVPGDGWAHHPYSLKTEPDVDSANKDNAPVAATGRLAATLKALVDAGRLAPGNADLYMTEYGYETAAPSTFTAADQARFLPWAESLALREPAVKMWPQFLLRDYPGDRNNPTGSNARPFGEWQSGLYYPDGSAKPAVASFRTPAVAECLPGARYLRFWGRVRGSGAPGEIALDTRTGSDGAWAPLATSATASAKAARTASAASASGAGFVRYAPVSAGAEFRMRWTASDGSEQTGPAFTPVNCEKMAQLARAAKAKAAKARAAKAKAAKSRAAKARAAKARAAKARKAKAAKAKAAKSGKGKPAKRG